MITVMQINHCRKNVRSMGDRRKKVDSYSVSYSCPADKYNDKPHEWCCGFEVPVGTPFIAYNFDTKSAARAASGYKI